MTSLTDKVARAQEEAERAWLIQAEDAKDGLQEEPEYSLPETIARAAISEVFAYLEEPSEAMEEAGIAIGFRCGGHDVWTPTAWMRRQWKAMLKQAKDEALNE